MSHSFRVRNHPKCPFFAPPAPPQNPFFGRDRSFHERFRQMRGYVHDMNIFVRYVHIMNYLSAGVRKGSSCSEHSRRCPLCTAKNGVGSAGVVRPSWRCSNAVCGCGPFPPGLGTSAPDAPYFVVPGRTSCRFDVIRRVIGKDGGDPTGAETGRHLRVETCAERDAERRAQAPRDGSVAGGC